MLFSTKNNDFRIRYAIFHDKNIVIAALQLFFNSHFITNVSNKRFKLTDLKTVVKKAYVE